MEITFDIGVILQALITALLLYFVKSGREESKEQVKAMQRLATTVELHTYQIEDIRQRQGGHCCEAG